MRFSIIVVCLNPGDKLNRTLDSVLSQTFSDYEIVVKDGGSRDGSVESMRLDARIRFYKEQDGGIYEAMNQAVSHVKGDFVLFLNCGDLFPDDRVLERTSSRIERESENGTDLSKLVLYGDTLGEKNGVVIASPPEINGFTCYRNIPCHQSCVYSAALCKEKPYDLRYQIRADYDHFLWCFYRAKAKIRHMDFPVASYEGGGYSENRENRRQDWLEHRQITSAYMSQWELLLYRGALFCTLAPLRRVIAESRMFSEMYHGLKKCLYARKK